MELTSRCIDGSSVAHIGDDEEGLDERAQGVDDVSEYFSGVLLHVVRLAERTGKKGKEHKTNFKCQI